MGLPEVVEELRLVDHHVHSVLPGPVAGPEFERFITESDRPAAAGTSPFDSQLGFALRRWCGPVLGLTSSAEASVYLGYRNSLAGTRAAETLLSAAGCSHLLVDTGFAAPGSASLADLGEFAEAVVLEVVRLESVAEELARSGCTAEEFGSRFLELLWQRSAQAAAVKSIVAYRHGLDFDPARPRPDAVRAAAGQWLRTAEASGQARVIDPVLLRHLLWCAVDRGLPIQLHTGFGDPDLDLRRADPALARDFLAACAVPVVLLHCYPFHRNAAFLAQAYPNVYFDLGLAINYSGARASAVLAEALELAPFGKVLFSSDAYGLPELVYLGARLWRQAVSEIFGGWVAAGHWGEPDAIRVASLIGAGNAARLYGLTDVSTP
ncbi:MAG: amidohydrolase family protein [Streptosporangiaceae bacterium]